MPKKRPATWFTAARPYLVYGALLAAGALALTWLDYLTFARTFPGELQIFRMPITFTEILPVGILVSLISALLLRNSRFMPARPAM